LGQTAAVDSTHAIEDTISTTRNMSIFQVGV
jgi:hypothetical protein